MSSRRGFSLLEVLFAVALFGAVVTFILSAQAGLVAGNRSAANMSQASVLGRCRMSELEEKQLKLGFPEIEEKDSNVVCCADREVAGFSCEWNVERVTLPDVTALGDDAGSSSFLNGGLGLTIEGGAGDGLPTGLANQAGSLLNNPMGGALLDFDAGLQNLGSSLQQSLGGSGAQGLLSMVFSIVYPSLKPLLEAAIRRITVVVRWREGVIKRDFTLTQYVTNPSRAGLIQSLSLGDGGLLGGDGGGGLPFSLPGLR